MLLIKDKKNLACVDFSELDKTNKVEQLFFNEPDNIVYVLEQEKLLGIITLGDFKRNYPEIKLAVNRESKRLVNSENIETDAKNIFINNPKINKIPVIDENGLLMSEIFNKQADEENRIINLDNYVNKTEWFYYYVIYMDCREICIIDYNLYGERFIEKSGCKNKYKIDIISPDKFSRKLAENYDLIIDFDVIRYGRRKELLRRISKKYTNKYTSPDDMEFSRKISAYYKSEKEKGVKFYVFEAPSEYKLKYMTDKQKKRINSNHFWSYYYKKAFLYDEEMQEIFGTSEYQPYIDSIFNLPVPVRKGRVLCYEEFRSSFCNCTGGYRVTVNKEWENYTQELDMYGQCAVFGLFVEDKSTISSYLQELLNKSNINTFNVNNYGIRGGDLKEVFACLNGKTHNKGDIIVLILMEEEINFLSTLDKDLPIIELSGAFNNEHERLGTFFIDKPVHCNYKANQVIAEKIFEKILEDYKKGEIKIIKNKTASIKEKNCQADSLYKLNNGLKDYLNSLLPYCEKCKQNKHTGAVVMNCNPFTKGHRYLIEQSAKQVDTLFIFVVEEDKSVFKFKDRMSLVKKGTEDIKNVVVLPSGNFIISSITFPEYFQKEDKQEVVIDASLDIEVFAQYIAPPLGITVRFAGEEPFDMVTRQYNELMKRILPDYGIEFIEIKRKTIENDEGNVISASNVRKYMKMGQWDMVRQVVPETTYNFLVNNYK